MAPFLFILFLPCRNYVSLDILHRVIEDYFGYNVLFVENITDIDDKVWPGIIVCSEIFMLYCQEFRRKYPRIG